MAVVGDAMRCEVHIEAPPEVVFEYFTDPALMVRWKGLDAKLQAHPGGVYEVNLNGRDRVVGEYVAIEPPWRVLFTWGWEGSTEVPPGSSTVEVTLTASDGGTLVRVEHRDLPRAMFELHDDGWEHYLGRLAVIAAGGDPGTDPWVTAEETP